MYSSQARLVALCGFTLLFCAYDIQLSSRSKNCLEKVQRAGGIRLNLLSPHRDGSDDIADDPLTNAKIAQLTRQLEEAQSKLQTTESPTESQAIHMEQEKKRTAHSLTINHYTSETFPHHPVMLEVGDGPYPVDARFLTEINGLKIPAEFDCNIFYRPDQFFTGNPLKRLQAKLPGTEERMVANNSTFWGNHNYFTEVQSRFHACWLHLADLNSGMTVMRPMLPIVDDEYNEQIAVYQSVLRAKNKYVIAELGARWGTWGTRSIAFLKHRRPTLPYKLYMVEALKTNCVGIERVLEANSIEAEVVCDYATATSFRTWADTVDHIDLIDFDIQRAELKLVPEIMDILDDKVYRVIIDTHVAWSGNIYYYDAHETLLLLLRSRGWIEILVVDPNTNATAMKRHIRDTNVPTNRYLHNWTSLLKQPNSVHMTPRGPVSQCDGELIFDNPKFVNKDKTFSLDDKVLKIDDLL